MILLAQRVWQQTSATSAHLPRSVCTASGSLRTFYCRVLRFFDCITRQVISWVLCSVQTTGHTGSDKLGEALYGCDLVLIPAGVPRKPGMTRDDLFNINASRFSIPTLPCPHPQPPTPHLRSPHASTLHIGLVAYEWSRPPVYNPGWVCALYVPDRADCVILPLPYSSCISVKNLGPKIDCR